MKSIRFLITDICNANCPHCINKKIRTSTKFMELKIFETLIKYFYDNNVSRIRIMGGEPTLHPSFGHFMKLAQAFFPTVTLFTNGISSRIQDFIPREEDGINFNSDFILKISPENMLSSRMGTRTLSVIINKSTNIENKIKAISYFRNIRPKSKVSITFDCTDNIFKDRKILIEKFWNIKKFCDTEHIETIIDHALPICFLYKSEIPVPKKFSLCSGDCAGMIDYNGNFRFCNQYSNSYLQILYNNKVIPFKLIENKIALTFFHKQITVLEKICKECILYERFCNGGCFIDNPNITKKDILENTQLPIIRRIEKYE